MHVINWWVSNWILHHSKVYMSISVNKCTYKYVHYWAACNTFEMLCISKWFLHFNFLILLFWITSVYIKLIMYIFLKHIFFYLLVFHLNTPAFAKNALFQFANILSFYIIMFSPISLNLFMAINFVNLYTCTASNSPIVYMPMNMKKNYHIFVAHTLMPWIMCL